MSLNCFSLLTNTLPPPISFFKPNQKKLNFISFNKNYSYPHNHFLSSSTFKCHLGITFEDIATITHNKVLISAGVSALVGQFLKPFTSIVLYGNTFDFRAFVQAGGFPSTHSSAVIATATSLALERGFSDSIFGLAVVYASLVMYDAQGVRREVGIHARTINRSLLESQLKSRTEEDGEDSIEFVQGQSSATNLRNSSLSEELNAFRNQQNAAPLVNGSRLQKSVTLIEEDSVKTDSYVLLKESIGHTEVEVIAGVLLGFIVSLTVHAIM